MHQCLAIPEILYAICEAVRVQDYMIPDMRTLATLARTCRVFQEPALDNLWYELEDLRPLIRCLPRGSWRYVDNGDPDECYLALTRGLTKSDVQTIQRYGQRVRIITIFDEFACGVLASSLQIIDLLPRPLFPNLRQLGWLRVPREIFPYLRLFLSKQLVSLDISIYELEAVQATLLNLIPSLVSPPILRHLHICTNENFERERVRFSVIAPNHDWSSLHTLALSGAAMEDIARIGDLPNLKNLTFWGQLVNPDELGSPVAGSFASLRVLDLEEHPVLSARWLPLFRNAKITKLSLSSTLDTECSDRQWRELFINLNENVDHESLRTLHLQFHNVPIPTLQSSDILPHLLCFTELRTFSIVLKRSLSLSYDETLELTISWPNITSVELTPGSFEPDHCSKLSSLALWAKNCPKLEYLGLSVDASDRDDRLDLLSRLVTPEFNAIQSSLSILSVGPSPITHKEFVALFLLKIFPNLKHIQSSPATGHRRWSKVAFLMSLMKASRDTSIETLKETGTKSLHYWWADRFRAGGTQSDQESDG